MKVLYNLFFIFFFSFTFSQGHWQTAIFAEDDWEYFVPDQEVPSNWNEIGFDNSEWSTGPGGFGYGDGDDGTIINNTISVFFRKVFTVFDLSKISSAVVSADYDDGFVAYINGYEIGRSYNLSEPGTFVPYNQSTSYDHEASLYSGGSPENIVLDSLSLDTLLVNGENIFAIQVHNVSINSSDMSGNFYLSFEINDNSQYYSPPPAWFQEPVNYEESNLPLVLIDTYGQEIPDEPRIPAYMGIINNSNGVNHINDSFNDYDGYITIEKRGNSSQWQDKPPYRFETVDGEGENNNVELLGMPEENDWVLYAPWQDKTMIRNVLTYQLSNEMGRYASRTKYVELFLNHEYQGVYVLMEKIKRDRNRVDISKLETDEIAGDDLTGGYILKFDWFYTGDNIGGFESNYDGMLYNYHYPKPSDIAEEQEDYIQNYISDFENIMLSNDFTNDSTGYPSILNIESFIDFILLQELSKNVDAYRLSTYIYKDKESIDNRLTAGPVWDFNHGFGNCDYGETWEVENWLLEYNPEGGDQMAFWWELLWEDEEFQLKAADRYTELRNSIFSQNHINNIIDSIATYLGPAVDRNFTRWPILGNYIWPNYYIFDTYDEEINYLKSWTYERLTWMDSELLLEAEDPFIFSNYKIHKPFPNPFNSQTTITVEINQDSEIQLNIYDVLGNKIRTINHFNTKPDIYRIQWNALDDEGRKIVSGIYFYLLTINKTIEKGKFIYLK